MNNPGCNNLNQLAAGDWTGTLSGFGWTRTDGIASLTGDVGRQVWEGHRVPRPCFRIGHPVQEPTSREEGRGTWCPSHVREAMDGRFLSVYSRPTANDAFALDKTVQFVYDGWLLLAESHQ